MTSMTLSASTQAAIATAINDGPGANNQNYLAAYSAISADISANGGFNTGTVNWFSQAGLVNQQATGNGTNAPGTFILSFLQAAAESEGVTVTSAQLQTASNTIALTVFQDLSSNNFVFSDVHSLGTINFSPQTIVERDAAAGIGYINAQQPEGGPQIDYAAWGGTLFARTELNDPTYFTDYNINLTPGSQDCAAIINGTETATMAVANNIMTQWLSNPFSTSSYTQLYDAMGSVQYVDLNALGQCLPGAVLPSGGVSISGQIGGSTYSTTIGANNTYAVIQGTSSANGTQTTTDLVSGGGAAINLSNANVVLAPDASASITGNDTVSLGAQSNLAVNGGIVSVNTTTGDTVEVDNSSTVGLNGGTGPVNVSTDGTHTTLDVNGGIVTDTQSGGAVIVNDGSAVNLTAGATLATSVVVSTDGSSHDVVNLNGGFASDTQSSGSVTVNNASTLTLTGGTVPTGEVNVSDDGSHTIVNVNGGFVSDDQHNGTLNVASNSNVALAGTGDSTTQTGSSIDKLLKSGASAQAQKDIKLGYKQAAWAAEAAFQNVQQLVSGKGKTAEQFSGQKWSQKVITWSLATSAGNPGVSFDDYMSATYGTAVAQAFATWAAETGLTFQQVSDSAQSDIRLGWADLGTATTGQIGNTNTQAHNGSISSVLIQLEDPSVTALQTGANGQLTYAGTTATLEQVLIHEIGHALGLEDNSSMNSIMGYDLTSSNQTLDAADITAIQSLYGAPQSSPTPTGAAQLIQAMATASSGASTSATTAIVPTLTSQTPTLAVVH